MFVFYEIVSSYSSVCCHCHFVQQHRLAASGIPELPCDVWKVCDILSIDNSAASSPAPTPALHVATVVAHLISVC